MASLLPILLLTSFLSSKSALCYINPPGATSQNNAMKSSGVRATYIVFVEPPPLGHGDGEVDHRRWHESFLPLSELAGSDDEPRLVHSYTEVFSGFAARLTVGELDAVSKKPGFVRAIPDQTLQLMTTHTPEYLGLRKDAGLWSDSGYGKGVIVGVLDTGIDASHPSFDDHGVSPPPARWKGSCRNTTARCNNKLIGVKSFIPGDSDTSDEVGHGTHTSSTAAGNFVDGAAMNGLGVGTAAGIAPGAHIAMYKVCTVEGCTGAALLGGIDEAIKDGVDVLSLSLGSNDVVPYDKDPIAIGAFSAVSKGIIVVCAAGNNGPGFETLSNEAPWMLTVAAGSVDRRFSAPTRLGDGRLIDGEALHQGTNSSGKAYPLFYSKEQAGLCEIADTGNINGKIVLCRLEGSPPTVVDNIKSAGAAGVVLINSDLLGYTTILRDFGSDVVQVTVADGASMVKYAESRNPVVTITFKNSTLLGVRPSPTLAAFSSRGPSRLNLGILKPDITAPGLNILAAWPSPPAGTDAAKTSAPSFNVISGTSMATPHVSGVAALVKSVHPDWSPAAIKSAILTTSDAVDNTGGPILDEQHAKSVYGAFFTGAGHVNPTRAADPGLVYDVGVTEYAGFICTLVGEYVLPIIVRNSSLQSCRDLPKVAQSQLNYPTITVQLEKTPFTVNRTVKNVGPADSKYTANVTLGGKTSLKVSVSPETLVFSKAGEKKTFSVTVSGRFEKAVQAVEVVEGSLIWVSPKHVVRSPVVLFIPAAPSSPPPPVGTRRGDNWA
uniref:Subtilisin-like protease n=1 Tax=Oryza punctata TaxID=4537 RepID=A0A0E0LPY2_ORYPU